MNFAEALQIWRPLGMLKDGSHISFEALTAIHYTHRLAAYVVVLALASLWVGIAPCSCTGQAPAAGIFAVLQVLTGLSNVVLDWPWCGRAPHRWSRGPGNDCGLESGRDAAMPSPPPMKWRAALPEA
jgi:cytochrome c oxidase assembly protein subunit 15